MKRFLSILILLALIMAAIPAAANFEKTADFLHRGATAVSTSTISSTSSFDYILPENLTFTDTLGNVCTRSAKSLIYSVVGAKADETLSENEIKALAIAIHTQLCYENQNDTLMIDTKDKSVYLTESELKNKFDDNYTTFCSYCDNVYQKIIFQDNLPRNLNLSEFSTKGEENVENLPTANPYEAILSDKSVDTVSTNKLTPTAAKLMSQQGNTYEEILNYYYQ